MAKMKLYNPGPIIDYTINGVDFRRSDVTHGPMYPALNGEPVLDKMDIGLTQYFQVGTVFKTHNNCTEYKVVQDLAMIYPNTLRGTPKFRRFRIMKMDDSDFLSQDIFNLKEGTLLFKTGMVH